MALWFVLNKQDPENSLAYQNLSAVMCVVCTWYRVFFPRRSRKKKLFHRVSKTILFHSFWHSDVRITFGSLRPKCLVIFLLKTSPNKQTYKNACPCFGYPQQSQLSRVRTDRWSWGSPAWQATSPGSRTASGWTCVSKRAENGWFSPTPGSRTTCIILLGSFLVCNVILYPPVIHLIVKECWILPSHLCLKGA